MRHRSRVLALSLLAAGALAVSCSAVTSNHAGNGGAGNGSGTGGPGGFTPFDGGKCFGLQCRAIADDCAVHGLPPTTLGGVVYDPAGALPLYNVYVYIPNGTPDPIVPGSPDCTQCQAPASGSPIIGASTDPSGHFTLSQGTADPWGVPSGNDVPLVIQVGKWRRQLVVPHIEACTANVLPDPPAPADKLRLPAKSVEGDMPLIAFTSGCDPAECFLRKIGIDDSEFVPPGSPNGHVHFYTGRDFSTFDPSGNASKIEGGNNWSDTYGWWSKLANLKQYDMVFNACDCADFQRGADAYQAMHDYLDGGGRVFTTHYYYNWFAPPTGPADFQGIANWALPEELGPNFQTFYVDTTFPRGKAFADWLYAQQATKTYGEITLADTRWDMNELAAGSTRWIYNADATGAPQYATMYMSFNTPMGQPATSQCGRAVFSDVHLSGVSDDSVFPAECVGADPEGSHVLNEKALEFLFFDLSSCVQDDSMAPPPPPTQ
jgi:hypothetical protein